MKLGIWTRILAAVGIAAGLALPAGQAAAQDANASGNLRLMGFGGDAQLTSIKHAVARFNQKYPNVKVEIAMDPIAQGWGDYVTRILAQFGAHNAYDIYGTAIETYRSLTARHLFLPLDDFIAKNPSFNDFSPELFKYGSYQGHVYFMPIGWNNIMINYNRTLFKDAGVDYPKAGWTWNDFRETAKKLTKRDASGNILVYGYEVPNQNFFVQPWFFSNGTSVLNAEWTHSNMLDPKVAESLQFLHDLIWVDKVSPVPGKDMMDNQFFAGQVAMISRGHWILENVKKAKMDMDIAIPPAKVNDDTVLGFGGYAIAATTKAPALAKALIAELTSVETQTEEGELGGGVPGRKSAAESPGFLAFPPSAKLYWQTLPHTKPVASPANFQEVEKIFIRYYQAMMANEMPIAEGVKKAHEELEASFKRLAATSK